MNSQELCSKLQGAIAFPVTPFHSDLSLDLAGLQKNVRVLLQYPIAAIAVAGGTGEMYSLMPSEHLEVVRAVVEEAHGQVPVISGTGFNYAIATGLARQSESVGVDAVLALPPYYPNSDEDGLAEYYKAIGDATQLPLLVYSRDWVRPAKTTFYSKMQRLGS